MVLNKKKAAKKKSGKKLGEKAELKREIVDLRVMLAEALQENSKWKEKFYSTTEGENEKLREEIDGLNQDIEDLQNEINELSDEYAQYQRDVRDGWRS